MITTKAQYVIDHPKSILANKLRSKNWPNNTKINIIGGLLTPNDKRSNLYKALQTTSSKDYIVGAHRQRGTEGWWIAVRQD